MTGDIIASCITACSDVGSRTAQHRGRVVRAVAAVQAVQVVRQAAHERQLDLLLHEAQAAVDDRSRDGTDTGNHDTSSKKKKCCDAIDGRANNGSIKNVYKDCC